MIVLNLPRRILLELIKRANTDLKSVSERLGRNHAYLQQYISRGTPRILGEQVRKDLGKILGVNPNVFLEENDPRRVDIEVLPQEPLKKDAAPLPLSPKEMPKEKEKESTLCRIPEYDSFLFLKHGSKVKPLSFWSFPREYVEYYTSETDNLALFCICGDGMAPEYQDGDYVLVDLSIHHPTLSGLYLISDGTNIVVKNVEQMVGLKPMRVKIVSANPIYGSYEALLSDVKICGRVLGRWRWQ